MKQSNKMEIRTELIKYSKWLDKSTLPECSQTDEVDLIRNVESYLETEGNYLILSDNIKKTKMFSAHPNGGSYGETQTLCECTHTQACKICAERKEIDWSIVEKALEPKVAVSNTELSKEDEAVKVLEFSKWKDNNGYCFDNLSGKFSKILSTKLFTFDEIYQQFNKQNYER